MTQRYIFLLVDDVDENGMALVEGAATAVLSAEPDRRALQCQRSERQRLCHAVVERTLSVTHLVALLEHLLHLGMDVEVLGIMGETVGDALQLGGRKAGIDFIRGVIRAAVIGGPVAGNCRMVGFLAMLL